MITKNLILLEFDFFAKTIDLFLLYSFHPCILQLVGYILYLRVVLVLYICMMYA
jgi:hypothetical protein